MCERDAGAIQHPVFKENGAYNYGKSKNYIVFLQ